MGVSILYNPVELTCKAVSKKESNTSVSLVIVSVSDPSSNQIPSLPSRLDLTETNRKSPALLLPNVALIFTTKYSAFY